MSEPKHPLQTEQIREQLRKTIEHLEHVLPAQAPIKDFVHHNTLHGFQHLPFPEAIAAARQVTGAYGYLSDEEFRKLYQQGRIELDDLHQVLDEDPTLQADDLVHDFGDRKLMRRDIYAMAMRYPVKPLSSCELTWQIEEQHALERFQADVDDAARQRLLAASKQSEADSIRALWQASLEQLGLKYYLLHPEELTDLSPDQAETMLTRLLAEEDGTYENEPIVHHLVRRDATARLEQLLAEVGRELTLAGLLRQITNEDIFDDIQPLLIRFTASYLDQGVAAWPNPDRQLGFYQAWRHSARVDLNWLFAETSEWQDELDILPEDALDTIIILLRRLDLPEDRWAGYLERLALSLPGWSGMMYWRHLHPGYDKQHDVNVEMFDYLAVCLLLERIFAQRLCRQLWRLEASVDILSWYFRRHRSEFYVRYHLFNTRLPEYLTHLSHHLVTRAHLEIDDYERWKHVANMIWTWRRSPAAEQVRGYTVYNHAWRLFRLAQLLGLSAEQLGQLSSTQVTSLFECLDLQQDKYSFLWLQAYERHYREQLFNAVVNNHNRGRWKTRPTRPAAQVVFCMDDREEGIRRHLEELDPGIETLGAAGFFGVAINWQGLDDNTVTPLCPIVVVPAHEVREVPDAGQEAVEDKHRQRRQQRLWFKRSLFQESRRNIFTTALLIALAAPLTLLTLLGKLVLPRAVGQLSQRWQQRFDIRVPTRVQINAEQDTPASPEQPRLGFTDYEQATRVQIFLRSIGLSNGFGEFVVLMGHGSSSQNNPHSAAYDCGACSGRHGGPNARVFAAMANRPVIRQLLRERGLEIPEDCWFVGAEHDTCTDRIGWYDTDLIPEQLQSAFASLSDTLDEACVHSAHERTRRFASAPRALSPVQALKHVIGRSFDFSQARPELGHATNAAAFIGRRSISQGAFFDRRTFLISYDPTIDPDGKILEVILLAVGPVGAGINLEYYFSTVDSEQYGCGSKVTHNLTGLFGVMHGASGDLSTGLPRQMTEIHEAMRLQVLVEVRLEILSAIYERQPPLQELIGNGWLLLSAKDPDSEQIHVFKPDQGFALWQGKTRPLPTVRRSADWYAGQDTPLTPVLIEQAEA